MSKKKMQYNMAFNSNIALVLCYRMSLFSSVPVPATTKNWKPDTTAKQSESVIWIQSKGGEVDKRLRLLGEHLFIMT